MPLVVDPDRIEIGTIRELVDPQGLRVLEIGCGDGRITLQYADEAAEVLAYDTDEEAIRTAAASVPARLRDRLRFELADAVEIDLPAADFDLALFSWSL